MADGWRREDGATTDAFSEAKRLVSEKLMPAAAEATTQQTMQVIRLSDLNQPYPLRATKRGGEDCPEVPG